MMDFIRELKLRNEPMFYFGSACLIFSMLSLALAYTTTTQVNGVNAWFKPFKFGLSTFFFA